MYNTVSAILFSKGSWFKELNKNYDTIHYKNIITGDENWHRYDNNGYECYGKFSLGVEFWTINDNIGNALYMKCKQNNDDMYEEHWWEYDHKIAALTNQFTSYKDSYGYWAKCEYDEHGRIIYYENSLFHKEWTKYDDTEQLVYVTDNDGDYRVYTFEDLNIKKV